MDIRSLNNVTPSAAPRAGERSMGGVDAPPAPVKPAASPVEAAAAIQPPAPAAAAVEVTYAVQELNKAVKQISQNLQFELDEDTNRPIVKLIDLQTKEIIRQIPTQEALELSKRLDQVLDKVQGLLFRQEA